MNFNGFVENGINRGRYKQPERKVEWKCPYCKKVSMQHPSLLRKGYPKTCGAVECRKKHFKRI